MSGGWLRRNRWGLVGLPVAAVLLAVGNGQRVGDFWWHDQVHYASAHADQGEWLTYSEDFSDAVGPGEHRIRFRVTGLERITEYVGEHRTTRITNPAYDAWRVHLEAQADPEVVLVGCQLALTEDDGTRYLWAGDADGIDQDLTYPCVPAGTYGPVLSGTRGATERELGGLDTPLGPRPRSWAADPVVFVAKGAKITGVTLWWAPPHEARVSVRPD